MKGRKAGSLKFNRGSRQWVTRVAYKRREASCSDSSGSNARKTHKHPARIVADPQNLAQEVDRTVEIIEEDGLPILDLTGANHDQVGCFHDFIANDSEDKVLNTSEICI